MVSHKAVHHQQRSDFAAGPQRRSSSRLFEPLWQSRQRVLKGRLIGSDMNSSTHGCCCADAYLDRAVRCIEVMIHSGIGNEGDLVWEMSCEITAGRGRGPTVVPAIQYHQWRSRRLPPQILVRRWANWIEGREPLSQAKISARPERVARLGGCTARAVRARRS